MLTLFRRTLIASIAACATLLSFTAAAGSHANSGTTYPLTVSDGMGNTVVLKKQPTRISSKTLFTDEILLSLVGPQKLTFTPSAETPNLLANVSWCQNLGNG